MSEILKRRVLPTIVLRGIVPFPETTTGFDIGRTASLNALKNALDGDRYVFLITQTDMSDEYPPLDTLSHVGCVAYVSQMLKMPDGTVKVVVEAKYRASFTGENLSGIKDLLLLDTVECEEEKGLGDVLYREALLRRLKEEFASYCEYIPKMAPDIIKTIAEAAPEELAYITDYLAYNIRCPYTDKIDILCELSPENRAVMLIALLEKECSVLELDRELGEKVREQIDDNNREYFLREQMKAINAELYGDDSPEDEFGEYAEKIKSLDCDSSVKDKLNKELNKLFKLPQGSHDGGVIRGYLDTCIELPWNAATNDKIDISTARRVLDRDFYGMEKVKTRILELLSVYLLAPDIKGQIICLVGPPGVGKTSIGKTIAECMGRRFARVSLGGVRDEAEIRGHRRTYVAAMPGKIINAIKQAGCSNPLILLDEIDKLGSDYKGDPASAMLEVLDPEQNATFTDHYLDMPYDLSKVLFITTANTVDTIPAPLLDRMEVIELSSYTREEKFAIAKKHLVSKQMARHGLAKDIFRITDAAVYSLIDHYTREAGVRKLEREIASLCRKSAKMFVEKQSEKVVVNAKLTEQLLGKHRYTPEEILKKDEIGVVNGLAWTAVGGEIMQLEVAVCEGTGKLVLTGSLGEVMQESAKAAVTFVRCHAAEFGISSDFYSKKDIHIHATEAAVPKDGPSAGVTITTALVSALTGLPVRRDIAMTGEVTIRGRVLKIGGLKEKSMAAYRGGVKTVFIPEDNQPDIDEIDAACRENIEFVPVSTVNEIVKSAIIGLKPQKTQKASSEKSVIAQNAVRQ